MITEEKLSEWSKTTDEIKAIITRTVPPSSISYISKIQPRTVLVSLLDNCGDSHCKLFTFEEILEEASK